MTDLVPLLIILPALNEQETLPGVLAEITTALPTAHILVVSDGSTDATAQVARCGGARVMDLPFNLGVGGAMRAGFRYAKTHGYTHVVQVDSDGQHDPALIVTLCECMNATGADIVVGARFAGVGDYRVRGPRRWAMRLLSAIISRVAHTKLVDTTSGFKLMGPRALELFAIDYPAEYLGDTVEALVIAARAGLRIEQVAVHMRPRAGGRPSHNPLKAAVFLVRAIVALLVALLRPRTRIAQDSR